MRLFSSLHAFPTLLLPACLLATLTLTSLSGASASLAYAAQAGDAGDKAELTVSAAASLTNAFTTLARQFEQRHPGVTVRTNFGASNPLLRQIEAGAPVDVFASADQETMDKAQQGGLLLPETRVDFIANTLVIIVPQGAKVRPSTAKGLRHAGIKRIGIGNPDSVPAGRYARDVLIKAEEWEALAPKYVVGQSVRQVLDYVARGEVDAGLVYGSDAVAGKDKVQVMGALSGHKPILYPLAVLGKSAHPELARQFSDFVRSAEGQARLKEQGFSPLPE